MKNAKITNINLAAVLVTIVFMMSCSSAVNKNTKKMTQEFPKGTYGYDANFLTKNNIDILELKDTNSGASVLLSPGLQGRVMTSSAEGNEGKSFGWINYSLISSGKRSDQFNPFGGEERVWLGPEGGPFSIYFKKGDNQIFANWKVPAGLDTEAFEIASQNETSVDFTKDFNLINASGTEMQVRIDRSVRLLTRLESEMSLSLTIDNSLSLVAFESENTLTNKGENNWGPGTGFLSVWMLAMFNPSEKGIVFIPFRQGNETEMGKIVTDDYFGRVPADRLVINEKILFFKTDGKYRSKIGISPDRALPYCGSYDPDSHVLTLLWYSAPAEKLPYVNSKWGKQDNPLSGDAVNSYNDGPVEDGSIMGPFYEIESSSPAAMLVSGSKITHKQRIFHISGSEAKLSLITEKLFNYSIPEIKEVFNQVPVQNEK